MAPQLNLRSLFALSLASGAVLFGALAAHAGPAGKAASSFAKASAPAATSARSTGVPVRFGPARSQQQAFDVYKLNGGRHAVTLRGPSAASQNRMRIDVAGARHFEKSTQRHVLTPHTHRASTKVVQGSSTRELRTARKLLKRQNAERELLTRQQMGNKAYAESKAKEARDLGAKWMAERQVEMRRASEKAAKRAS